MQRQGLHKTVSNNKYLLFYILLFFHHVAWFNMCLFHDSLNDSGSATLNCFSKTFPKTVHKWTGMVVGILLGQIFSWATDISSSLSAMHRPQCLSVMKAKIHFIDFRYWQFELTCWSACSNHTKISLCTLFFGPIPYWGIVCFPPQNEHPHFHQMNWLQQQLLVCYRIYDISREPLYFISSPQYILWFPTTSFSSWSCAFHLLCKTQQTNVKCRKKQL